MAWPVFGTWLGAQRADMQDGTIPDKEHSNRKTNALEKQAMFEVVEQTMYFVLMRPYDQAPQS